MWHKSVPREKRKWQLIKQSKSVFVQRLRPDGQKSKRREKNRLLNGVRNKRG